MEIAQLKDSHARLRPTLAGLSDAGARRPSLLPGWTVGHVLTHLARNADSHVRMLEASARDEVGDQYPGGNGQRAADIEAGAGRPAAELVADVVRSAARLDEVLDTTPEKVWRTGRGRVASGVWPLAELPFRRWREVEIHHVDLGLAYGITDWPDSYVDGELALAMAGLPARLGGGTALDLRATDSGERWLVPEDGEPDRRRAVAAERRVLLAWLVGRHDADDLPVLAPWTG
jgi:maleylpyruvate isomerase